MLEILSDEEFAMLKRIAVVGGDEKTCAKMAKLAGVDDVRFVAAEGLEGYTATATGPTTDAAVIGCIVEAARSQESSLTLLGEALDCREERIDGDAKRMVSHATRFADALQLSDADRSKLERAALLRDIGKMKIENSVLVKDGILSYDDWSLLHEHPTFGAELVKAIPHLSDIEDIVRHHHECFDGDGYPAKLEGEAIPYLARALKVLDVYCAMTSPRIYREGEASPDEAIDFLKSERGKHLDPELVDIFLDKNVGQAWDSNEA